MMDWPDNWDRLESEYNKNYMPYDYDEDEEEEEEND